MSEREILLRRRGARERECWKCPHAGKTSGYMVDGALTVRPLCPVFDEWLEWDEKHGRPLRCAPCLAAERAAAQLREDAKFKARWERLREWIADGGNLGMVLHQMRKLEKGE